MVTNESGKMIILSSPSGAGKTTLTKKLATNNRNFSLSYLIPQENQDLMKLTKKIIILQIKKNLAH